MEAPLGVELPAEASPAPDASIRVRNTPAPGNASNGQNGEAAATATGIVLSAPLAPPISRPARAQPATGTAAAG